MKSFIWQQIPLLKVANAASLHLYFLLFSIFSDTKNVLDVVNQVFKITCLCSWRCSQGLKSLSRQGFIIGSVLSADSTQIRFSKIKAATGWKVVCCDFLCFCLIWCRTNIHIWATFSWNRPTHFISKVMSCCFSENRNTFQRGKKRMFHMLWWAGICTKCCETWPQSNSTSCEPTNNNGGWTSDRYITLSDL